MEQEIKQLVEAYKSKDRQKVCGYGVQLISKAMVGEVPSDEALCLIPNDLRLFMITGMIEKMAKELAADLGIDVSEIMD